MEGCCYYLILFCIGPFTNRTENLIQVGISGFSSKELQDQLCQGLREGEDCLVFDMKQQNEKLILLSAWGEAPSFVYSHLYLGGIFHAAQNRISWKTVTDYPWEGRILYEVYNSENEEQTALVIRIPGWCPSYSLSVNGKECTNGHENRQGYITIKRAWKKGDTGCLQLSMEIKRIYANLRVREDTGCIALMRGPLVYCIEEADNGTGQNALLLPAGSEVREYRKYDGALGDYVGLEADGLRLEDNRDALYSETPPREVNTRICAVPYFLWGNRQTGEMRVWIREK